MSEVSPSSKNFFYYLGLVSQVGFTMVLSILIFLLIGVFLDRKIGSKGIIIFLFSLLGIGAGFFSCYRLLTK